MARFTKSPEVAERRAKVLALRIQHETFAAIAAELGIPESTARTDYERALAERNAETERLAAHVRGGELAKLDVMERAAWRVLRARHITVQHGKIVRDEDGVPVLDDAPVLNAIDRLVRIAERRARLLGLDAPVRTKIEVTDALDAQIEQLVAELAGPAAGSEAAAAGPAGTGSLSEAPA